VSAYEQLLDLAGDAVKTRGAQTSELLCPGHEDSSPSLSLSRGRKDNAVAKCQAGCRTEDVMAEWYGGSLSMAALFDRYWDRRDGRADPLEVYVYTDEAGEPLFEVGRFPGKKFCCASTQAAAVASAACATHPALACTRSAMRRGRERSTASSSSALPRARARAA